MGKLTEEQYKLINDNFKFACSIAKKRWTRYKGIFEFDEFQESAYWGLVKAARTYDPVKGEFIKYAGKAINRTISRDIQKMLSHKEDISLNKIYSNDADKANELIDTLKNKEDDIGDFVKNEEVEHFLSILNKTERELIEMYFLKGISQTEISEFLGVSQPTINKKIMKAIEKMKEATEVIQIKLPI